MIKSSKIELEYLWHYNECSFIAIENINKHIPFYTGGYANIIIPINTIVFFTESPVGTRVNVATDSIIYFEYDKNNTLIKSTQDASLPISYFKGTHEKDPLFKLLVCPDTINDNLYKSSSILDYPRKHFDEDVWNTKKNSLIMKKEVKKEILDRLYSQLKSKGLTDYNEWIKAIYVPGSIATLQYKKTSDIDVHIYIDYDYIIEKYDLAPFSDEEIWRLLQRSIIKPIMNINLTGTKHPINYHIQKKERVSEASDAVYDLLNNIWIDRPYSVTRYFNPEKTYEDVIDRAEYLIEMLDLFFGKLRRNLIAWQELNDYLIEIDEDNDGYYDIEDIRQSLKDLQEKILKQLNVLVAEKEAIKESRNLAYTGERLEGKLYQEAPENIIYKYLEKFNYWTTLKDIDNIASDEDLSFEEQVNLLIEVFDEKL